VEKRPLLVVRMNFNLPEKEAEFNEWYNRVHVPDMLRVPGVISGARYEVVRGRKTHPKYLAIYEIENEGMIDSAISGPQSLAVGEDTQRRWGKYISDLSLAAYKYIGP